MIVMTIGPPNQDELPDILNIHSSECSRLSDSTWYECMYICIASGLRERAEFGTLVAIGGGSQLAWCAQRTDE